MMLCPRLSLFGRHVDVLERDASMVAAYSSLIQAQKYQIDPPPPLPNIFGFKLMLLDQLSKALVQLFFVC